MILKRKGINTPEPLALIEDRNFLNLLGYSYLITISVTMVIPSMRWQMLSQKNINTWQKL